MPIFSEPIENHAKQIINEYYLKKMNPTDPDEPEHGIHRVIHGAEHISRASFLSNALANLYRKHEDPDALALKEEDLKLIQLAVLFHDSGRKAEGEDYWDHDSALNLYRYLKWEAHYADEEKIKLIVEAVANKDAGTDNNFKYKRLIVEKNDSQETPSAEETVKWEDIELGGDYKRNIYQKIIRDADCLEIIRARDTFEMKYLDFFRDHKLDTFTTYDEITKPENADFFRAYTDINQLRVAQRHLICAMGDRRNRLDFELKKAYENEECYSEIVALSEGDRNLEPLKKLYSGDTFKSLNRNEELYTSVNIDSLSGEREITEDELRTAIGSGRIMFRGVREPHIINPNSLEKHKTSFVPENSKVKEQEQYDASEEATSEDSRIKYRRIETNAMLDIRKWLRVEGEPSRNDIHAKPSKTTGNERRSVSFLGDDVTPLLPTGFIILDPNLDAITSANTKDIGSGRGKKRNSSSLTHDKTEIQKGLSDLRHYVNLGKSHLSDGHKDCDSNEVEMNLSRNDNVVGILVSTGFTVFPGCVGNDEDYKKLTALYLQKVWEQETERFLGKGKKLPIFIKSSDSPYPEKFEPSEDEILELWVNVFKRKILNKANSYDPTIHVGNDIHKNIYDFDLDKSTEILIDSSGMKERIIDRLNEVYFCEVLPESDRIFQEKLNKHLAKTPDTSQSKQISYPIEKDDESLKESDLFGLFINTSEEFRERNKDVITELLSNAIINNSKKVNDSYGFYEYNVNNLFTSIDKLHLTELTQIWDKAIPYISDEAKDRLAYSLNYSLTHTNHLTGFYLSQEYLAGVEIFKSITNLKHGDYNEVNFDNIKSRFIRLINDNEVYYHYMVSYGKQIKPGLVRIRNAYDLNREEYSMLYRQITKFALTKLESSCLNMNNVTEQVRDLLSISPLKESETIDFLKGCILEGLEKYSKLPLEGNNFSILLNAGNMVGVGKEEMEGYVNMNIDSLINNFETRNLNTINHIRNAYYFKLPGDLNNMSLDTYTVLSLFKDIHQGLPSYKFTPEQIERTSKIVAHWAFRYDDPNRLDFENIDRKSKLETLYRYEGSFKAFMSDEKYSFLDAKYIPDEQLRFFRALLEHSEPFLNKGDIKRLHDLMDKITNIKPISDKISNLMDKITNINSQKIKCIESQTPKEIIKGFEIKLNLQLNSLETLKALNKTNVANKKPLQSFCKRFLSIIGL